MKFEFWTSRGATHIRAQFDDDDNPIGRRQEGPGTEIKYLGEDILIDYEVKIIITNSIQKNEGRTVFFVDVAAKERVLRSWLRSQCFLHFFEFLLRQLSNNSETS